MIRTVIPEAESVLASPGIRFHIQDAVLAFLHGLEDPTVAEWRMMERLAAASLSFGGRLRLNGLVLRVDAVT